MFRAPPENAIARVLEMLPGLTKTLLTTRKWILLRAAEGTFLTSDAPVTLFTRHENHHPFFGIGYGTAEEICLAIDRQHTLLFVNDQRATEACREIEGKFVAELNRRTATHGVRWIIHCPDEDPMWDLDELLPSAPKWEFDLPMRRILD